MIECSIFFDVETLPTDNADLIADIAATVRPPATMSKPETIAKWEEEQRPAAVAEAVRKTSLDGGLGRIASISWAIGAGEIVAAHTAGPDGYDEQIERRLLAGFFDECEALYREYRSQPVLVGHNVLGFDIRWLWKRAVILRVPIPDWWPVDAKAWSRDVYDTMLAWEGHGGRISQDRLARILGLQGKRGVDGSMVAGMWDEGRYDEISDYCGDDVECVREIWKRLTGWTPPIAKAVEPKVAKPVPERKRAVVRPDGVVIPAFLVEDAA